MNKLSIFGGRGFIGSYLADSLPFEETIVVDRECIEPLTPNVINLISTVDNYNVKENPFLDIETNLIHFMKILSKGYEKWGKDLVFNQVSTWFVYDGSHLPANEESPCNPTGFYSITALAREQLLKSYCGTFGLKYRILRLGNVIGVGDKKASPKKNALQWMVKELAQGRDVSVYKGGAVRDFIDVRDCVRAVHLVLEKGKLNQTYNVANGQGLNISALIDVAHRASGYKAKVKEMEVPNFHKVVQTPKMYLDVKKLKGLGYVKQHDIKTTIEELVHYYERNEA